MRRGLSGLAVVGALALVIPLVTGATAGTAGAASGVSKVAKGGTSSLTTGVFTPSGSGDVTDAEFPGEIDEPEGPEPFTGTIVDRSLSRGSGTGATTTGAKKAKSKPVFGGGFEGLNLYQQRYARGGNQFTLEPPDQALCVGNGFELEAVNDVLNVYDSRGASQLPDNTATNIVSGYPRNIDHAVDLNSF